MAVQRRVTRKRAPADTLPDAATKKLRKPRELKYDRNFWVQGATGATSEDGKELLLPPDRTFAGGSHRILAAVDVDIYQRHGGARIHALKIEGRSEADGTLTLTVLNPDTRAVLGKVVSARDGRELG